MNIKQINSMTEVDSACWNNLVHNADPFVRHEFLSALEQSGAVSLETGWQARHLLIFDELELIAAMPLYLKHHSRGEYVFDQQWADAYHHSGLKYFPKWVNAIPFTPCQGQRILISPKQDRNIIMQLLIDKIVKLSEQENISSLHCLFPNSDQNNLFKQHFLIREGVQFQWFNNDYLDFNDYLQAFTSRQRKNIKKERQSVLKQGIRLEKLIGQNISEQQWQVFFQFYQLTYLKRAQSPYLNLDFFKLLASSMPEQILLILAIKDHKYVGAALSFIGKQTLYGRYWGCYEEYNSLHFEACYYQGLDFCIEHKLTKFDSGAQGEHKISRGFKPITTYSAHWIKNKQFSKLIADFLQQEKSFIQQYKNDCTLQLPYKLRTEDLITSKDQLDSILINSPCSN